jgi:hypothetical protein
VATETLTQAPTRKGERLDPSVFRLPVERIREGYYSDVYFNRTVEVLHADNRHPHVLMQVFQKNQAVIGGMDEAIAIVKLCSDDFSQLRVHALYDGDEAAPWETTMTIEGDYSLFARLETVYLGVLSRRTKVATNVRRVVEAANGKQIMFFPARHDRRRLCGPRLGRDRCFHRRAGIMVGWPGYWNGAARVDRRLRRRHRAGGAEICGIHGADGEPGGARRLGE